MTRQSSPSLLDGLRKLLDLEPQTRAGKGEASAGASLWRPVWITSWISIAIGALLVTPIVLPVYGSRLPGWTGWTVLAEPPAFLLVASWARAREAGTAFQWLVSTVTGPLSAIIYAAGVVVLVTVRLEPYELLGLAIFGVFGLVVLAWSERWARRMDGWAPPPKKSGAGREK